MEDYTAGPLALSCSPGKVQDGRHMSRCILVRILSQKPDITQREPYRHIERLKSGLETRGAIAIAGKFHVLSMQNAWNRKRASTCGVLRIKLHVRWWVMEMYLQAILKGRLGLLQDESIIL